jgi:hypothetical protein
MRTAQKYMQAADKVRTKLLKAGNDVIATSWDVAPSAMTLAKRKSLTEALGELREHPTPRAVIGEYVVE